MHIYGECFPEGSEIETFWWHVTQSSRIVVFWRFRGDEHTVRSRILPKELGVTWFMEQKTITIKDFITATDDQMESFIMMVKIDKEAFAKG
jgi:hypothetical protein